ncbi:hypothetical protein SAMN05421640_0670 [Ekhidna lutea]|uniref:Uncharacterized protein n=1 Tax=Ekhidna lutea TaxID=447679 RepID=A0A239FHN0_EKHLU|nr:hypothetical protein [Ekhidna lutea]SNS56255.1 hypothetical protein SAMN05421640_0670 [Ekhidna lutea]
MVHNCINNIENEFNVEGIKVNGNSCWPLFRNKFFELIRSKKLNVKSRINQVGFTNFFKLLWLSKYGIKFLLFPKKVDFLIFSATERRKELNGQYHDRVVEGIHSMSKSLLIENPFPAISHIPKRKLPNKNVLSESALYFLAKVFSIGARYELKGEETLNAIKDKYDIQLSTGSIIKRYLGQKKVGRLLVTLFRPKAVFFVYSASSQGYINAFKEASIPVIELQHGVINKEHIVYNNQISLNRNMLPDYLLTYGEYELQLFDEKNYFVDSSKVFPIGNYLIDYYRERIGKKERKKQLVFSGQSIFDKKSIPWLIEIARALSEWEIVVVPRQGSDMCALETAKNIYVERKKSIYEVITESNLHCTVNSSSCIDALALGIPTIFLNVDNQARNYYENVSKFYSFADNPSEAIRLLESFNPVPESEVIKESKYFVVNDYYKNIDSFLKNRLNI